MLNEGMIDRYLARNGTEGAGGPIGGDTHSHTHSHTDTQT